MSEYVNGFCFSSDGTRVVLIKKTHPPKLANRYNGIGGKVELSDDTLRAAMSREFFEEAGVATDPADWYEFLVMRTGALCARHTVHFFIMKSDEVLSSVKTMTDELVRVVNVCDLSDVDVLDNLKWIVPLALDPHIDCPIMISNTVELL